MDGVRQPDKNEDYEAAAQGASGLVDEKLDKWNAKYEELLDGRRWKMSGFNRVVMMGGLTRDPEVKQIKSGHTVAELGLAVTEIYKTKEGEFHERICYVDVVAWGKQAEACGEHLKKGSAVIVEGKLQLDQWETSEGQKRSKHLVRADRVQFLRKPKNNGGQKQEREPAMASASAGDEDMPF
jgi:single-strand DNA-binding protein